MKRQVRTRTRGVPRGRFRLLWFEQFEQRLLLTSGVGAAVEFQTETPGSAVSQVMEGTPSAQFRLELSDLAGQPITSLQAGEEFYLNAYVADLRSKPQGVFAAYLDLAFDAGRIVTAGSVEFGSVYKNGRGSGGSVPGLLDEVGGFSGSIRPLGAGEFLLFRAPFRAEAAGTVSFLAEPATSMPRSVVLLYGEYAPLASERIDFGSASLDVLGPRDSSLEDFGSPAAGLGDIGNADPFARSRPDTSSGVPAFLPRVLQTGIRDDLLLADATSLFANATHVALHVDRPAEDPTAFAWFDLETGLTDAFIFAERTQGLDPNWWGPELFSELNPRPPVGRSFSILDTPGFLLDDYGAPSDRDRVADAAAWAPLFHDHEWLTAGLLRIGWTTQLGRGKDADVANDDEMFDLARIAYETMKPTRARDSESPRMDCDDEEEDVKWVASLEDAFREETEIEGIQGTVMALEVDAAPNTSPSRKAARGRNSVEAAPTNSPNNKRAEESPERKAHDDTTPAA